MSQSCWLNRRGCLRLANGSLAGDRNTQYPILQNYLGAIASKASFEAMR